MIERGHVASEHFVDADGGPVRVHQPGFGDSRVWSHLPDAVRPGADNAHGIRAAMRQIDQLNRCRHGIGRAEHTAI